MAKKKTIPKGILPIYRHETPKLMSGFGQPGYESGTLPIIGFDGRRLAEFDYKPLISQQKAEGHAVEYGLDIDFMVQFCFNINLDYCKAIVSHITHSDDLFHEAEKKDLRLVTKRILDLCTAMATFYNRHFLGEPMHIFYDADSFESMDNRIKLMQEIDLAAKITYNQQLEGTLKKKRSAKSFKMARNYTTEDFIVLMDAAGMIKNMNDKRFTTGKQAKIIAEIIDRDSENIRALLTALKQETKGKGNYAHKTQDWLGKIEVAREKLMPIFQELQLRPRF